MENRQETQLCFLAAPLQFAGLEVLSGSFSGRAGSKDLGFLV